MVRPQSNHYKKWITSDHVLRGAKPRYELYRRSVFALRLDCDIFLNHFHRDDVNLASIVYILPLTMSDTMIIGTNSASLVDSL